MKKVFKWFGIIVVLLIVLGVLGAMISDGGSVSTSTGGDSFVIKLTGTEGLEFSGTYMLVTTDGKSASKTVDGILPTEYLVDASIVSVSFQKQSEGGTLKVEILKGEEVKAESETTAVYGVVTAATQ